MNQPLEAYRNALQSNPHVYPLLVDALRALAGRMAGDNPVKPAPRELEGSTWNESQRSYWSGYWWPFAFGNMFVGLNLMFEWRDSYRGPEDSPSITWIPVSGESGYAAYVEIRKGTRHDGKIVSMLSLERFIESLTDEGVKTLSRKIEKASVGVYDQSQLRGGTPGPDTEPPS